MAFHVYVEGALDQTPDGVAQLAQAIGTKFGLPATDIATRLSAGRFRVKANVDRATADTFARALQELGARVKIDEAAPGSGPIAVPPSSTNAARTSSSVLPAPALPRTNTGSALPSPALPRTSTSPALPRTSTGNNAKAAQMSSGLAAAFSQSEAAPADLGALSSDSLSLASLDGNDTGSNPVVTFAAPANLPASIGPAAIPATPAPAKAKQPPVDLFAPPDAEDQEALVDLAPEEVAHRERKAEADAAARAAAQDAAAAAPVLRKSQPVIGGTAAPSRELTRPMFAAGILLAIVIGFVPVHFVASLREKSAYAKIDEAVHRTQQLATDDEAYAALDKFRSAQLSEKQSTQRSIALTSLLMWAVLSTGLAFLYFKRPWEKAHKPQAA
jgi:hypothetical protein